MKIKKHLALGLSIALMITMLPFPAAFAVDNNGMAAGRTSTEAAGRGAAEVEETGEGSDADAAEDQVVVLYESDAMPDVSAVTEAAVGAEETLTGGSDEAGDGLKAHEVSDSRNADEQHKAEAQDVQKRDAALAAAQEEILDAALDGNYKIEDTIASNDLVIGVISSDVYDAEEMADILQNADGVKYAEPNYKFKAYDIPDWSDTYLRESWQVGERGIHADALGSAFTGEGSANTGSSGEVVVAVIDTGIDYDHPDLKDRMWTEPDGYPLKNKKKHGTDMVAFDYDPMDENGHGTHCAGIIAAAADNGEGVIGVAGRRQDIKLMAVRVLDANGEGYLSDIVSGFRHLIRAKKAGVSIRVASCSFGANVTSDIFDEVIDQAGEAGILTVAAAGNETEDNDTVAVSPSGSKSDCIVSVAATDADGSLASYSNYGRKKVDVGAPGSNILSTVCYDSYTPYIYDNAQLRKTTEYYGEFAGAEVVHSAYAGSVNGSSAAAGTQNVNGGDRVTPVVGTDYSGAPVTGVKTFGESRMLSNIGKGSSACMSLAIVDRDESLTIGNESKVLRWSISGAKRGDEFILYFPYDKQSSESYDTYMNASVKTHTEKDSGGAGYVDVGDVVVYNVDASGRVSWRDAYTEIDENFYYHSVTPDYNSIWHMSGTTETLLPYKSVKGIDNTAANGTGYGLGFVYVASKDGDVYMDISSLAVSRAGADTEDFGKYDVYSGTSMATPVVSGSAALIAAMDPELTAEGVKGALFAATGDSKESGKWSTNGVIDFSNYMTANAGGENNGDRAGSGDSASGGDATNSGDSANGGDAAGNAGDAGDTASDTGKPAVTSVTADFAKKTVTLKGRGFGTQPLVKIHNNTSDEEEVWTEVPCTVKDGSIVIAGAGSEEGGLGIIGSDISFTITNGAGMTGYITKYVVNGLRSYEEAFKMDLQDDMLMFDWHKDDKARTFGGSDKEKDTTDGGSDKEKDTTGSDKTMGAVDTDSVRKEAAITDVKDKVRKTDEDDEDEDESEKPTMPIGLNYVPGSNELLKFSTDGSIYKVSYDKKKAAWKVEQRGSDLYSFVGEYAKEEAEKNDYWKADFEKNENYYTCTLIADPAYLGETVFELVRVSVDADREATLLVGLDLNDGTDSWSVYYDSMPKIVSAASGKDSGKTASAASDQSSDKTASAASVRTDNYGKAADGQDFGRYDKTVLAAYGGRLYMIGGGTVTVDEDIDWIRVIFAGESVDGKISIEPYKEVYSCVPIKKASVWQKAADLPEPRMLGTAIAQNGNLYYMIPNIDIDNVDYNVYRFNGSKWSVAGKLNKAIFTGYSRDLTEIAASIFIIQISGVGIPCAIGADDKGILFGGMSFDRSGDSFRFNTKTGKVEELEYSMWGDASDCDVNGGSVGGRFYAEYIDDVTEVAALEYIPITSDYVKIKKTVSGEGSGTVTGGGYYTKGEKAQVTIAAEEGSYVYEIHTKGLSPNINKEYGKATKASKGVLKTTFKAQKNAEISVDFGKISTKVIVPKKEMTMRVGRREIDAHTDGTISEVKWKSSNSKYAKVNSDGSITFKRAGIGKTVKLTASSVEVPKLKETIKVKILPRESKKFKWSGKKLVTKTKVFIDQPLAKGKIPKKFRASGRKSGVRLSWSKVKGVSGYIVLRKTGSQYKEIARVGAGKTAYVDRKTKKGRKYRYIVVSYSKVKGSKSVRISKTTAVKTARRR